jgi:hypothetical protein
MNENRKLSLIKNIEMRINNKVGKKKTFLASRLVLTIYLGRKLQRE